MWHDFSSGWRIKVKVICTLWPLKEHRSILNIFVLFNLLCCNFLLCLFIVSLVTSLSSVLYFLSLVSVACLRLIGPFLSPPGWSTGSFLTLMTRWWVDISQVFIICGNISFLFTTALNAFGDISSSPCDVCLRSRSSGSYYPDAVQSSSGPAGHNMVSTLKFNC